MSECGVVLRRGVATDGYALWLWANDPETRNASFGREIIPWDVHIEWLERTLADPSALLLVGDVRGQPVGSIRFDSHDDWCTARLSYVVAPEARGQGFSRPLVSQGVQWLRSCHPAATVHADVVQHNERSLRLFRHAGWSEEREDAGVSTFWLR